jgi:hypothetical protein
MITRSRLALPLGSATVAVMVIWGDSMVVAAVPDGPTPVQLAAIAADPPFKGATLALHALPEAERDSRQLFNGRDLEGWDSWLGYKDPRQTYTGAAEPPIGLNHDTAGVFTVVSEDGRPAI